jgi:solute carrier family 35 protein F5
MLVGLSSIVFVGAFAYYWSLIGTTVPTNTALYQMNCCFVFLLCVFALGEKATLAKVGGVFMCCSGTVLVILSGRTGVNQGKDTLPGIALTLLSTIVYAVYECSYEMLTKYLHTHGMTPNPKIDPPLFLCCIGFCTLVVVWPALIVAHFSGIEEFELPPTQTVWTGIMQNAVLESLFNAFLVVGIADSSAIIMSTGTQFTVPVAYVVDSYRNGYQITPVAVTGALLLSMGFVILEVYRSAPSRADVSSAGRQEEISWLLSPLALEEEGEDGDSPRKMR